MAFFKMSSDPRTTSAMSDGSIGAPPSKKQKGAGGIPRNTGFVGAPVGGFLKSGIT